MNKTYKSIWNEALGTYVAAAEVASSGGRKTSSTRKARRAPLRSMLGQMALEPRIVFDAALPATVVDFQNDAYHALPDTMDMEVAVAEVDPLPPLAVAYQAQEQEGAPVGLAPETGHASDVGNDESGDTELLAVEEPQRQEIIFVDGAVPDLADFIESHPGEVIFLDPHRDGMEQIAEALRGRTGVTAIHILSHAEAGQVRLGSSLLTADSILGEHADEMAVIRAALAAEADILLYGCDIAGTEDGLAFVRALADATGADVAASIDTTGSAELGGNWVLEVQHGQIDAETLAITAWHGLLAQNNTGAWT
ncbi:DUF4347 domain-containing protein, partial [Hydrogenophaga sp.]|uniref:DUF4347 domain-containing protein n=1 Tax=Hydrogenophaga sp. TaxID=1904254 RepID=UPI002C8ABBF1